MITNVKHTRSHSVKFSNHIFISSILDEARSLGIPGGQAEEIAKSTLKFVKCWIANRSEVTSADIRRIATRHLKKLNPELAYMYSNHHQII